MVCFRRMLALADHPSRGQSYSNRPGLPVGMSVRHLSRCFCFRNDSAQVVSKVCPDRRNTHRPAIAARALAVKRTTRRRLPRSSLTDSPEDSVGCPTITALWVAGVFAGEARRKRILLDVAVTLQTANN